jgi:hypothetical protein
VRPTVHWLGCRLGTLPRLCADVLLNAAAGGCVCLSLLSEKVVMLRDDLQGGIGAVVSEHRAECIAILAELEVNMRRGAADMCAPDRALRSFSSSRV